MNEKTEIYKQVYKDSNMSISSIKETKKLLKEKDNKIKNVLDDLIKTYKKYEKDSKIVLKKLDSIPENDSIFTKVMANMGIKKEVKNDNSDTHIAQILIQGITMGTINMEKKISDYGNIVDENDLDFAKKFLIFQQESIEKLKEYL